MRAVVFDLDGTLADTSGDLIAAANVCLAALGAGAVIDPVGDREAAFGGGRALLRLGLGRAGRDPAGADAAYRDYLEAYGAEIDRHTVLFPGVEAALDRLAAGGAALGICTNKPADLAEVLLARLGLSGRFSALVGAGTLPVRKPDPAPLRETLRRMRADPAAAVLVGDTITDRDTARAAGVPVVLVTFGGAGAGAAALAPDGLIEHFDGLDAALARLI